MTVPADRTRTQFREESRKAILSASDEEFLRRVREADRWSLPPRSLQRTVNNKLELMKGSHGINQTTIRTEPPLKGILVRPDKIRNVKTKIKTDIVNPLMPDFEADETQAQKKTHQFRQQSTADLTPKQEEAITRSSNSLQAHSKSLPRISLPLIQTKREEVTNQFAPENISPLIRKKLNLPDSTSKAADGPVQSAPQHQSKSMKAKNTELEEVQESLSSEDRSPSEHSDTQQKPKEEPFHESLERNEFLTPQTIIQRHLEEINIKKQLFMVEVNELDQEMGMYKAKYDQARLLRVKEQREQEIRKLEQGAMFIENATYQVKEWRVEKKEEELRKNALQELKMAQEKKQRKDQKEEQMVAEIAKVHRQRMEKRLIQHLIERIRKEEKRRLRLAQPRPKTPNFVKIEERLKKQEEEAELQYRLELQKQREAKLLNSEKLKEHERLYNQKLKARAEAEKNLVKQVHHAVEFTLKEPFVDFATMEQLKQRRKRQADFSERIRGMKLDIDEQRREHLQMTIDKNKSPSKYELLRARGYSDMAIFRMKEQPEQAKDAKWCGNAYLAEMKLKHSSVSKLEPHKQVTFESVAPLPRYIDYLKTMPRHDANMDPLEQILRRRLTKEEKAKQLIVRSDQLEGQVEKQVMPLPNSSAAEENGDPRAYLRSIQQEKKVDGMFVDMLKARLAAATLLS